ncbi:MAG: hypothetical protein ACLUD1_02535 [Clostridia bacterium]
MQEERGMNSDAIMVDYLKYVLWMEIAKYYFIIIFLLLFTNFEIQDVAKGNLEFKNKTYISFPYLILNREKYL